MTHRHAGPRVLLTRRSFLRRLAAAPTLFLGGATSLPGFVGERQSAIGRFHVAGFQYYRGPELIARIRPGSEIRLVAEPENPYDVHAVRVEHHGEKLGYVPRRENQPTSRLLQDGARINGRVIAAEPDQNSWRMLLVETTLH